MSQPILDLWPPHLETLKEELPVDLLRQQASLLEERTGGLLQANVPLSSYPGDQIEYDFYLRVPGLGEYRYRLFSLRHGVPYYPLEIRAPGIFDTPARVESREQLIALLRMILFSEETRQVIGSLLALSKTPANT